MALVRGKPRRWRRDYRALISIGSAGGEGLYYCNYTTNVVHTLTYCICLDASY